MGVQSLVFSLERAGECGGAHRQVVASSPPQMQQRKVRFSPTIHLTSPTLRRGGGTLSAPSRQLARTLEACDLIKIIVLMQNHKCQEDTEGCVLLFTALSPGTHRLPGKHHNLSAQALHVPGCGIFPRNLVLGLFFFFKHTSFYF